MSDRDTQVVKISHLQTYLCRLQLIQNNQDEIVLEKNTNYRQKETQVKTKKIDIKSQNKER